MAHAKRVMKDPGDEIGKYVVLAQIDFGTPKNLRNTRRKLSMNQPESGNETIPQNEKISGEDGQLRSVRSSTPTSRVYAPLLKDSKHYWQEPHNIKEFVSQINKVATALLNGEADIEVAKAYGSLARTVTQAMGAEVLRARIMHKQPDLEFISPPSSGKQGD